MVQIWPVATKLIKCFTKDITGPRDFSNRAISELTGETGFSSSLTVTGVGYDPGHNILLVIVTGSFKRTISRAIKGFKIMHAIHVYGICDQIADLNIILLLMDDPICVEKTSWDVV